MATQQSMDTVQKAYIGYYGRPADPAGLTYWADRLDENGGDLSALINEFGTSDEYASRFEGMSNEDLVNNLYQQLFNRDAEQEGLDFYVAKLENNESSLSEIALDIMNGAQNSDATALENKLVVANDFTAQVEAEDKVYGEGQIDAAVDLVEGIDASTDLASVDVGDVLINFPNPPMPNALFTLKEQTETVTITTSAETTTTVVYWGYNPHSHDESGDNVDNLDGNDPDGNDNNLTNEGPLDGGVPWAQLLIDLSTTGSLGFDLETVMATMTTAAGNDAALDNLQTLTIGGDTGDGSTTSIQVTLTDGSVHDAIVEMNAQSKAFLNDLLFDSEGNSRLYEQEVVTPAGTSDVEVDVPVVLTPTENSGNTEEEGYTGEGDNFIVAGRAELLHKAYIDGGEGVNTLEVDMKGVFAQPKEIVNVQHISVQNLPNIYTAVDSSTGDASNSYDPDNADLGEISADSIYSDSVLDLSRAIDIETLTITESGFEGLDSGTGANAAGDADDHGSLTIAGIRSEVVTTIEGNFEQNVTLHYREGLEDAIGVRLNLGDVTDSAAVIQFAHNSSVAEIESFGAGNILDAANLGTGTLHTLNITGDAQFVIRDDAAALFSGSHPAEVDASANTAGVDLTITAYADEVIFTGTAESDDHFNATGNGKSVLINGGNGDNEFVASTGTLVTINSGDGNNEVNADTASDDVNITLGDGNNTVTADTGATVTNITVGNGDNTLGATGGETVAVVAGDGDNTVDVDDSDNVTVTLGAGDNSVRAEGDAETVAITTGDGDNSIIAEASVSLAITTGAGDDTVAIGGAGTEFAQTGTALVNIDLGAGDNTLTLGSAGAGDLGGVTALDNSTITGSDIAVVVYDTSNLCAAELTGITSVTLRESADLTLTAAQFAAIGADNFDVAGSKFGQTSTLTLVVENDLDLSTLNLENLDSSISINLTVANNATLTLTAEELHSHVAENGIDVDDANGYIDNQVVVTDAGIGFDPFAQQNGGTGGGTIVSNVDVTIVRSTEDDAFERPSEDAYEDALVINTDTDTNVDAIAGVDSDVIQSLIVEGAADINFTGSITLAEGFDVDFSALGGSANELTLSQFERVAADIVGAGGVGAGGNGTDADDSAAWGEIIGNGTTENPARINIEVTTGSTTGYADITKGGFKSSGVQTYVVTEILDANGDLQSQAAGGTATIYVCDQTQDLETIGLQNNRDATVTFNQVNWNTAILLEGDGYENSADQEKNLGNPDLSEVGAIVANFFEAGANAEVLITNQGQALGMAEDAEDGYDLTATRTLDVEGITVTNADRLTIDVEDGNAVINAITAVDVERLVVNSANDVTVKVAAAGIDTNDLVAIDASGVAGTFTLNLTNGTYDLSGVDLTGIEALVLGDGVNAVILTLSATQLIELKDVISDTDSATTLNVVGLSDEALNLTDLDVDTIGTVTFADVDGTIEVNAEANFDGATSLVILAEDSDTTVAMTAAQFNSTDDQEITDTVAGAFEATLVLSDLANDETLTLSSVDDTVNVTLQVSDLTATDEMVLVDAAGDAGKTITLEVSGVVDLTEAELGVDLDGGAANGSYVDGGDYLLIDAVNVADGATLTLTAAQVEAIGFADTDGDGVADGWSGTGTLNIIDLSTEDLRLDMLEAAGINIGTVSIENTDAAIVIDADTTFGGADDIITPTADDTEFGTEQTTVTMTVAQFATSGGIITGDSLVNLTDLTNNVDSDDDDQLLDEAEFDFSGIANAGTVTFAADTDGAGTNGDTITLTDTANLGGFSITLAAGDLIRFATEAQAATDVIVPDNTLSGVQWLFDAITAAVDTSGYDEDLTTLFIDEALLVANANEEDLWTDLFGSITVNKINGSTIPELVKNDRINTFEAFANIGEGVNYDDDDAFSTVSKLTMNLEGEVNLGNILVGDTNNGDGTTPNIDGEGFLTELVINSYEDLRTAEGYDAGTGNVLGRVVEANYLGDISLNTDSVDDLTTITINTYGDDPDNDDGLDAEYAGVADVNDAVVAGGLDGLAIDVGTITFGTATGSTATSATLTLTGAEDITIGGVDISDTDITLLTIDASDFDYGADNAPEILISGTNQTSTLDADGVPVPAVNDVDFIYVVDGHTSAAGSDFDGDAGADAILIEVVGGDNDLTAATITDVDAVHVSADATITLTADQVFAIGTGNFTVADGVTVTLNVTDLGVQLLDLNAIQDAGFNIGVVSTVEDAGAQVDTALNAGTTLGGADELRILMDDEENTLTLTATQYLQISNGNITEVDSSTDTANGDTVNNADVTITDLSTASNAVAIDNPNDDTRVSVNIDLSTVATTGTHKVQLAGADTAADVTIDSTSDLGDFTVVLDDKNTAGTANDLAGQTVRFTTEEQAARNVEITNVDDDTGEDQANPDASEKDQKDTNVVWDFDTVTGAIDTSGYDANLGRLWVSDVLVQNNNDLEDLFDASDLDSDGLNNDINLNGNIIVRIVNTDDLDALDDSSNGFSRNVEIEAFTDLSTNGLVFDEQDQLVDVRSLTIDLGGEVNLGDLVISNVLAATADVDSDEFDTLTINSLLATAGHYLLPEDFVAGTHSYPDTANIIGDISSGAGREELSRVVVNATDVDLEIGTITFADDGNDPATPADGVDAAAAFTITGAQDVTVASLNTDDADITSLAIINSGTGTLTITGASPAAALSNTDSLLITNGTGNVVLGTAGDADKPGIAGADLTSVTVANAGLVDLGVIALVDSEDFTLTGAGAAAQEVTDVSFRTVDAGDIATVTIAGKTYSVVAPNTDEEALVDLLVTAINDDETATFTAVKNGAGATADLRITADETSTLLNVEATVEDTAGVEQSQTVTTAVSTPAVGTVATLDAATAGTPSLSATGTWSFSDVKLTISEDVVLNTGATLELEDVVLITEGDVDLTVLVDDPDTADVEGLVLAGTNTFEVPEGTTLTLTAAQADGQTITGAGTVEITDLEDTPTANLSGIMTGDTDTGSVNAAIDTTDIDTDLDSDPEAIALAAANLGVAHITVSGDGSVSLTGTVQRYDRTADTAAISDDAQVSFTVGGNATLNLLALQVGDFVAVDDDGNWTLKAAGTGTVAVANLFLNPDADLSGLTATTVTADIDADTTFTGDFGDAVVSLNIDGGGDGAELTADITVLDGVSIGYDQTFADPADDAVVNVTSTAADQDAADAMNTMDLSNITARNISFDAAGFFGAITFPVLATDTLVDPDDAGNTTDEPQSVMLTSAQADSQTITGEGNVTVDAEEGITLAVDLSNITATDPLDDGTLAYDDINLSLVFASGGATTTTLSPAADLGDFDIALGANDTLIATGAQVSGLDITGTGTLELSTVADTDDLSNIDAGVTVEIDIPDGTTTDLSAIAGLDVIDIDSTDLAADDDALLTLTAEQFGALDAGTNNLAADLAEITTLTVDVVYSIGASDFDVDLTVDPTADTISGSAAGLVQAIADSNANDAGVFTGMIGATTQVTHTELGLVYVSDSGAAGTAGVDTFEFIDSAGSMNDVEITSFTTGVAGDIIDFTAFLGAASANMNGPIDADGVMSIENDVTILEDIVGNEDITTAAGLDTALAGGGEYASVDMAINETAIILTTDTAGGGSGTVNIFYATSDGAGTITTELVGTVTSTDVDTFVAGNFA